MVRISPLAVAALSGVLSSMITPTRAVPSEDSRPVHRAGLSQALAELECGEVQRQDDAFDLLRCTLCQSEGQDATPVARKLVQELASEALALKRWGAAFEKD
jgi:hypothetical protein